MNSGSDEKRAECNIWKGYKWKLKNADVTMPTDDIQGRYADGLLDDLGGIPAIILP